VELRVSVTYSNTIKGSDIVAREILIPPEMYYSLDLTISPHLMLQFGKILANVSKLEALLIIAIKDNPVKVTDFIDVGTSGVDVQIKCSSWTATNPTINLYHCAFGDIYEKCLLEKQSIAYRKFNDLERPVNGIFPIPDSSKQLPSKIFLKVQNETEHFTIHGHNDLNETLSFYVGFVANQNLEKCFKSDMNTSILDISSYINITIKSNAFGCYFWDQNISKWSQDGCKVSSFFLIV
jgi:hypothetical protein